MYAVHRRISIGLIWQSRVGTRYLGGLAPWGLIGSCLTVGLARGTKDECSSHASGGVRVNLVNRQVGKGLHLCEQWGSLLGSGSWKLHRLFDAGEKVPHDPS